MFSSRGDDHSSGAWRRPARRDGSDSHRREGERRGSEIARRTCNPRSFDYSLDNPGAILIENSARSALAVLN